MPEQVRVFISSTSEDLKEYRSAVRDAILAKDLFPDSMENWATRDSTAIDLCRQKINQAHIYIGIYAHRYGWQPEGYNGKSITELEYDWATERKIHRLCFIVDESHPWPDKLRDKKRDQKKGLLQFKRRLQKRIVGFFTTPDDLRAKAILALDNLLNGSDITPLEDYLHELAQEIKSYQAEHIIELLGTSEKTENNEQAPNSDQIVEENVFQLVKKYEQCVIVGEGGIGKTQTLYQLILNSISDKTSDIDNPIPLFIRFSEWNINSNSIETYIRSQWQQYGLNIYGDPIDLLATGKVILFADGINEINAVDKETLDHNLRDMFRWIDKNEGKYPKYVVLTSRLGDYLYYRDSFAFFLPIVEIKPLTEKQITLIAKSRIKNVEQFITALKKTGHLSLAQNPWLLSSLIELFLDKQRLPANQGQLFKIVIEGRVKHEVRKNNPLWKSFQPRLFELQTKYARLVYSVASRGFYIPVSFSNDQIGTHLSDEDVKAGEAIGIVVTTVTGLRFTHQRYAEYFIALYLVDHLNELSKIIRKPHLSYYFQGRETERPTQDWDQPIIILSGIIEAIDNVIEPLLKDDPWLAAMCISSGSSVSFKTGQKVIQALLHELKEQPRDASKASVLAFTQLGTDYVESLCMEARRHDGNIRKILVQAIGIIGSPKAVDDLLTILEVEENFEIKALIVEALRRIGDQRVVPKLLHLVDEADNSYEPKNENFYTQLVITLGIWRITEAIDSLIQLREKAKGPDVDRAIIQSIGLMGVINEEVKEFLLSQLKYTSYTEEAAEVLALLNIGEGIDYIFEQVSKRNGKADLAKALHHLAFSMFEDLVTQNIKSENSEDRAYIAKLIGWVRDDQFLPILKQLCKDISFEVRGAAVEALKSFEKQSIISLIIEMLFDNSSHVRRQAAIALDEMDWTKSHQSAIAEKVQYEIASGRNLSKVSEEFATRAIPYLLPLLKDDDRDTAYSVASCLEKIGWEPISKEEKAWFFSAKSDYEACLPLGEIAIPAIVHKLRTRSYSAGIHETFSPLVKLNASYEIIDFFRDSLHEQKPENIYKWELWLDKQETLEKDYVVILLTTLIDALLGENKKARDRAIWAIRNYHSIFELGASDVLQDYFLQDIEKIRTLIKNFSSTSEVAWWIVKKTGIVLIEYIIEIFEEDEFEEDLMINCIFLLGLSEETIAVEKLKTQLNSTNREFRSASIKALANHPSPEVILLLINFLKDKDTDIADEAFDNLVEIGVKAVPLLREALTNESTQIRIGAIMAIGRILEYREKRKYNPYHQPTAVQF